MKSVSGKEMCRILERHGWTLVRSRESHFNYKKPGGASITVPVHANESLKIGLPRQIMKLAGLSESDL